MTRLEVALFRIANNADLRRQALAITRRALERDMVRQVESGRWTTTPAECRAWWYERPDEAQIQL